MSEPDRIALLASEQTRPEPFADDWNWKTPVQIERLGWLLIGEPVIVLGGRYHACLGLYLGLCHRAAGGQSGRYYHSVRLDKTARREVRVVAVTDVRPFRPKPAKASEVADAQPGSGAV